MRKGKHQTKEQKKKDSEALKKYYRDHPKAREAISKREKGENNPFYGKKHTKETKEKISETKRKYYKDHPEVKEKYSEIRKKYYKEHPGAHKGENNPMYGKKLTKEAKEKIGKVHRGKSSGAKGKHWKLSKETKEKMRESAIKYIEKIRGKFVANIGRHEKQILDELEKKLHYRIIRQYEVSGYFLDGYIPEINLAIEVDEKYHENQKEKDIQREEFIKEKLGCQFLRIKDYY